MSEIKKCRKISLGWREEQFLSMITGGQGSASAYSIYSELNEGETDNGKARKLPEFRAGNTDSMAYKNVHKRIKRLETLGLIEPLSEKKEKRKKIKYIITSRGLFQQLLGYQWGNSFTVLPLIYKNDIILQTILYRYFEFETVDKLIEIFGSWFFNVFIKKCCEGILEHVSGILSELEDQINPNLQEMWPHYYPDKIGRQLELILNEGEFIDKMIRNEAKNLTHEIVRESAKAMYDETFPYSQLLRDEKFKPLLKEVKNEFEKGYRKLHPTF